MMQATDLREGNNVVALLVKPATVVQCPRKAFAVRDDPRSAQKSGLPYEQGHGLHHRYERRAA
jgi:hypothetical protein